MSLYDDIDMCEITASFGSHQHGSSVLVRDSLADELGDALGDESYETDTSYVQCKLRSSDFDYTGNDWGDPAEDSDPDGRFASLNDAMYALYEAMDLDLDSAYISDDLSEISDDLLPLSKEVQDCSSDDLERFVSQLRALASQGEVERNSLKLIHANNFTAESLARHCSELRDKVQGYLQGLCRLSNEDVEVAEVRECLELLQKSLPTELIMTASIELSLLEAETNAVVADLCLLKDSLQERKQTLYQAQRIVKTAKESCYQWLNDAARVEEARAWLLENDVDSKVSDRAFSKELTSIKLGFEEVCTTLRRQISGEQEN
ncbi:Putative uncharacterized protein [Taphrina deformans PYCC 5710]|uniref:Uncharacterized protein n=1 Tax=Taphrina deformans (strain PYCC 5710 / ATCC 11124 / CBS 356.35 / IMI 108563 / JCM 9778 / NBRC 8474) TaxID=1097556 RepID=R4X8D2_TAPDE|nr:Putative uncharacterized protein [Taphrina deformans PYCC 5710]|eukprot:CCG81823.1 Putative uncharacterized protein [Taphrina deformans PYCC 5710]